MSLLDKMDLCERQQDLAEARMEVCYDEAEKATDVLWEDFNMVEGNIHLKEVMLWAAIIGALNFIEEIE